MIDDNKVLISHLNDILLSVKKGRKYAFSSFLNVDQLSDAYSLIRNDDVDYRVYGGYDDAERCMIGFGADDIPEEYLFPISTVSFSLKNIDLINHRNVLGTLMSLGIKRECIGDIIFKDGKCYVFTDSKIADFLLLNFVNVSSFRIEPEIVTDKIEFVKEFEHISITVSSLRLDCLVSELAHKSRTVASELIESGLVFLNSVRCQKKDKIVTSNDIISIRRIGKYMIDDINGYTKKNRIKLNILKYI